MLKSWCYKAYPNDITSVQRFWRAVVFGLFVTFFLAYFKPFGFDGLSGWTLYRICFQFGAITTLSTIFLGYLTPLIYPSFFQPEKWVIWKELVFTLAHFVFIGLNNALYLYLMGYTNLDLITLIIEIQSSTLAVGLIPVIFFVYYDQANHYQKYVKEAEVLNNKINEPSKLIGQALIKLFNENGELEFQIPSNQILFIKSDGNYLELYLTEADSIKKHLLRNRIKAIEKNLDDTFIRCHRSYIVNLNKIRKVDGNARGYELTLDTFKERVPVSRSLSKALFDALESN